MAVTAYGSGWVAVNGERVENSLVVDSGGTRMDWPCSRFDELGPEHFSSLCALKPELLIFGSGRKQRFVPQAWLAPLTNQGIGVEAMDTAAACRTYNVLAAEGRHVVAALLVETDGD